VEDILAKTILEFDIEKEKTLLDHHMRGPDMFSLLHEFRSSLRSKVKHGDPERSEFAEEVLKELIEEINMRGLTDLFI